ncbi:RodZ domain-containing protein [Halopseudomonas sp.]|uniref:RodZ domain-containing protein n=1 Tax=Halopseudomonas sp. TaxID=2901191 RepID=UPI00300334F5
MSTEQHDVMPPKVEAYDDGGRMAHPGATLQAARQAKGLSTAEAATSLRLPEKILAHLEAGRFDQLPGDTFARGYVRSYARLLGLDANRLVLEYDRARGIEVRERQVSGIDKMGRPGKTGGMLMTWTTIIVALAIIASILLWWYDSQPTQSVSDVAEIASQALDEVEVDAMALPEDLDFAADSAPEMETGALPADPVAPPAAVSTTDEFTTGDSTLQSSETAETFQAEPSELSEATTAPAPAPAEPSAQATAPVTPVASPAAENEQPVASSARGLQMRFSGDCWVQITTAGGESLHSALMQAGQTLAIDHPGPINVVIGAVEAVSQIAFNGEPVDTNSVRQSGVVRLRLG